MDRMELEELWRSRVAEAKSRYDTARNRTNAVIRDFPFADTAADGHFAYRHAIGLENVTIAEYNRVLRIFADLVHRGIVPDENEWRARKDGGGSGSAD